ncbi:MAG: SPOR domain-containing protein [Bacteroidetes bacterium]|nr:SPOR domain-containing protein [Bacteroidota bacterium]
MVKVQPFLLLAVLGFAVLLLGCTASDESTRKEEKSIQEHEQSFDPAEYRTEPVVTPETPEPVEEHPAEEEQPLWVERTERVMGYRLQLFSTTDIDKAQDALVRIREDCRLLNIDVGRIDMSFDAPYYKVRAGDFLNKTEADTARDMLHEAGLEDAWVVRDNVFHVIREKQTR